MVKNKKMSKTSIAVIVLAVLLVLSLVMGLTGAWFTNKATSATQDENYSFKMGQFFNLNVEATGGSSMQILRDANGDGDREDSGETISVGAGENVVYPGDYIDVSADAKMLTIKAEAAVRDFWYVYKVQGNSGTANANWYGDDGEGKAVNNASLALRGNSATEINVGAILANLVNEDTDDYISLVEGSKYQVLTSLTTAVENQAFTLTVGGVSIEVRAMQIENIDAAGAYTYLTNDFAVEPARTVAVAKTQHAEGSID